MTVLTVTAQGLAVLSGKRILAPPKPPVPRQDYETLLAACGRSSELLLQLTKRLALHESEDAVSRGADAHRRYLKSLGSKL